MPAPKRLQLKAILESLRRLEVPDLTAFISAANKLRVGADLTAFISAANKLRAGANVGFRTNGHETANDAKFRTNVHVSAARLHYLAPKMKISRPKVAILA